MVFTLQSQSSEKSCDQWNFVRDSRWNCGILWRNPCTPRAIDTDSVSKLLLAHRLYLVPGILGMVIILLFLLGTVFPEKIRTKIDTCVERVLSKVWIWLIIVGVIGVVFYMIYNYNLKLFNFRGSIWYFSFMGFLDGTLWQKLMGVRWHF